MGYTKSIVAKVAFLAGISLDILETRYGTDYDLRTEEDTEIIDAWIVRKLCTIRYSLMKKWEFVSDKMTYEFKKIEDFDFINTEDVEWLEVEGYDLKMIGCDPFDRMLWLDNYVRDAIGRCKRYFPDWLEFDYLKKIFVFPVRDKKAVASTISGYNRNLRLFPCQAYLSRIKMDEDYLLSNDRYFLEKLYRAFGDHFKDIKMVQDINYSVRESIEEFFEKHSKIGIAVDCENADVYKVAGLLKGLGDGLCEKVQVIMLFDDVNTTKSWKWLKDEVKTQVEHVQVNRVTGRKSLVDISMTAEVTKACYRDGYDGFILVSSDSDFWGLISSVQDADFIVAYEDEKCGDAIKRAMQANGVVNCSLDRFSIEGVEKFKEHALKNELSERVRKSLCYSYPDLVNDVCQELKIEDSDECLIKETVKNISIGVDTDGEFCVSFAS